MENEIHDQIKARPQTIPRSTYSPFLLAVSLLFMGWGLLSFWFFAVAGTIAFFVSLSFWIKEILHEQRTEHP